MAANRKTILIVDDDEMVLQLLERGSLLPSDCKKLFGSIRNLARRLAESLRNRLIPPASGVYSPHKG